MKSTLCINHQRGISLLELIIAIAIFASLAGGIVTIVLSGLDSGRYAEEYTVAYQYASEGIEAVRSVKNISFDNLNTTLGTGITSPAGTWVFQGPSDTFDKYTRTISVSDVYRDGDGNILSSGGTLDPLTKKVTSKVNWHYTQVKTAEVSLSTYLTNWGLPINKKGILVYGSGSTTSDRVVYTVFDPTEGVWSSTAPTADIDTGTTNRYLRAVSLYSSPVSSEKIMLSRHYNGTSQYIYAQVFDGSGWGNVTNLSSWVSTSYLDVKNFSGTYMANGNFMAVYSDNSSTPKSRIWNGSSWESQTSLPSLSAAPTTIVIDVRPNTNEVMFASFNTARRTQTAYYDGSSWTLHSFHANGAPSATKKMVDFAWSRFDPASGAVIYTANSNDKSIDAKIWTADGNGSGSWSRQYSSSNQTDKIGSLFIKDSPMESKFIMCNKDDNSTPRLVCCEMDINGSWVPSSGTVVSTATQSGIQQSMDGSYDELVSGEALAVYSDNTSVPKYKLYEAGVWGSQNTLNTSPYSPGTVASTKIYAMPGNYDQLILFADTSTRLYSVLWDGINNQVYTEPEGNTVVYHSNQGSASTDFWYDFSWDKN